MQTSTLPALFVGHGSPMNALEENDFTRAWKQLGEEIPRPKAVLCVSAHWLTRGTFVTAMQNPRTIHDFGGFPQALFEVQYPAPGSPAFAREVQSLLPGANIGLDGEWGLDHGTWSVLRHVYPKADVPVLQLSIDYARPGRFHFEMGRQLARLRREGYLVIGSGNIVHNLRRVDFSQIDTPGYGYEWAIELNDRVKHQILEDDPEPLIDWASMGPSAHLAIPTPDHYDPLLYVLGMREAGDSVSFFNDVAVAGSLTMTSVRIG
jgi:4,5-DOPA dioxygenase extradiol